MKKLFVFLALIVMNAFTYATEGPILIQGAMDLEVGKLVESIEGATEKVIDGYTFWEGKIDGRDVVISRTEIGLVNATASTVIGIKEYKPSLIINQGTSGGHDPKLHTFDIVLGESTFNLGAYRSAFSGEGEGIHTSTWERIPYPTTIRKNGEVVEAIEFYSDKEIMEVAMNTEYKNGKVVKGIIGSADQWNREIDRINEVHAMFGTSVEEMETVAVAQMAAIYDIPFMGIRVLSNTEVHAEDFNPKSAIYCQDYVIDVVKAIK